MRNAICFILPEVILGAGALALLMGGALGLCRRVLGLLALISIVLGFSALPGTRDAAAAVFAGMLVNDFFGLFMKAVILLGGGLAVLMSIGFHWPDAEDAGEYYFFLLSATLSMMLAVSAGNLVMIYLTVETLSIISYVLACHFKKDLFSTEAGLKYFLFGALATGLMLYGISLIYGLAGTLDLKGIAAGLATGPYHSPTLVLASVLVFAGLAFKASLVPFHMWVADVYEGAPWPVAAFFSVGPKALGFALLFKVFGGYSAAWTGIIVFLAVATMTVGNFAAFHQNSVKRLLAFSSVAQAGYILAGFSSGVFGTRAAFFYIVIYTFMNMGAFSCAAFLSPGRADLASLRGVGRQVPVLPVGFAVFLLSLAGLPPLAGFFAKFFVVCSAVMEKHYWLAGAVLANSVVAFFYYLKIIKAMFFDKGVVAEEIRIPMGGQLLVLVCLLVVVALGVWPQPVMNVLGVIFP